ncbi:MAG: CHAT domain-containing protein, partial [Chloroflexota bacterium]|nr:CHAT domain-containing protein [Chloroflexota bacterium]
MEQPALLNIVRTDTTYRFRLDIPDHPSFGRQEYTTEITSEIRERLRRALQSASQHMQTIAVADGKRQTMKMGAVNDSLLLLGHFLFEILLPSPIQEALHNLDTALILNTNTPTIPWELMFEGNPKSGRFLSHHLSLGRQMNAGREGNQRPPFSERPARKSGRRETQGLTILFLVNPTGERHGAEEEVATLCTTLPEVVSRIILYRQQANQLEMRMRISSESPQVIHYAGPFPTTSSTGEPALALAGNSRLDGHVVEPLLQALPRHPLIFLSSYEEERHGRNGNTLPGQQEREETLELLASKLMAAGAGGVVAMRWPVNPLRSREFAVLFYQEVADGVSLGEAMRRTRASMAKHHPEDTSWMSYMLYGNPTSSLITSSAASKDRSNDLRFDGFDDDQLFSPLTSSSSPIERRFLQEVIGLSLLEARRMHKDYLGTPHLFIALTKLDGGCTQDALRTLGFSAK